MKNNKSHGNAGFTIKELIVVVFILGVLALLLMPQNAWCVTLNLNTETNSNIPFMFTKTCGSMMDDWTNWLPTTEPNPVIPPQAR